LQAQVDRLRERLDFIGPMLPLVNCTNDYVQKVECEASVQLTRLKGIAPMAANGPKEQKIGEIETVKLLRVIVNLLMNGALPPAAKAKEQLSKPIPRHVEGASSIPAAYSSTSVESFNTECSPSKASRNDGARPGVDELSPKSVKSGASKELGLCRSSSMESIDPVHSRRAARDVQLASFGFSDPSNHRPEQCAVPQTVPRAPSPHKSPPGSAWNCEPQLVRRVNTSPRSQAPRCPSVADAHTSLGGSTSQRGELPDEDRQSPISSPLCYDHLLRSLNQEAAQSPNSQHGHSFNRELSEHLLLTPDRRQYLSRDVSPASSPSLAGTAFGTAARLRRNAAEPGVDAPIGLGIGTPEVVTEVRDGLVLGRGSWGTAYRKAEGSCLDALRMLCKTGIVTEGDLRSDDTTKSPEHIECCVSVATEMLCARPLDMWTQWQPREVKLEFESRLRVLCRT